MTLRFLITTVAQTAGPAEPHPDTPEGAPR